MPLFLSFIVLLGFGIVAVYTASYPKAMTMPEAGFNSFYFTQRQIVFAVIGLALMFFIIARPLEWIYRYSYHVYIVTIVLLVMVLVFGRVVHGNQLSIWGIQPSEFAKVGLILALSAYLAKYPWRLRSSRGLITGPLPILGLLVVILMLTKDLGTTLATVAASVAMLAVAGMKFRFWGLPVLGLLALIGLMLLIGPKALTKVFGPRADRFAAWMNPEDTSIKESFQPRNSLIAIGSGGLIGRGFCQSRQKWFYLPGAHNDYIMAVLSEELGFLKLLLFLFLPYMYMVYRAFTIAHRAPDEYGALVATGCTVMLATQAIINMSVVTNIIPCMGINLPFISYGGSSLVASLLMAGLLLNVSTMRQVKERKNGEEPAMPPPPATGSPAARRASAR